MYVYWVQVPRIVPRTIVVTCIASLSQVTTAGYYSTRVPVDVVGTVALVLPDMSTVYLYLYWVHKDRVQL